MSDAHLKTAIPYIFVHEWVTGPISLQSHDGSTTNTESLPICAGVVFLRWVAEELLDLHSQHYPDSYRHGSEEAFPYRIFLLT